MSLSRPTAHNIARKFACTTGVIGRSVWASAAVPALAHGTDVKEASAARVNAELAVCPGQTFSQPFEALKDSNYYTLVEGSEFAGPSEGWELTHGAEIVEGTGPEGASLVEPSEWRRSSQPAGLRHPALPDGSHVRAERRRRRRRSCGRSLTLARRPKKSPRALVRFTATTVRWTLSNPFNVQPREIGGKVEEKPRQVRFHFDSRRKGQRLPDLRPVRGPAYALGRSFSTVRRLPPWLRIPPFSAAPGGRSVPGADEMGPRMRGPIALCGQSGRETW